LWASKDFAAKSAIFRSSKSANFAKNVAANPKFCQFTVHYFMLFITFQPISSKSNISVTTASSRHFVSFSSKAKSFGA